MRCGQWMPTIWRRWRRWYASRRSSSAFVRPHVPMLYINTGTTKDSYNRSRNGRLIPDRLNHTVNSLRNATFASCFRRATSSASPSNDPSLRVILRRPGRHAGKHSTAPFWTHWLSYYKCKNLNGYIRYMLELRFKIYNCGLDHLRKHWTHILSSRFSLFSF